MNQSENPYAPSSASEESSSPNGSRDEQTSSWAVLKFAVIPLLLLPVGMMAGMFLGLVSDFGFSDTVENIRLNPGMFADQYASGVFYAGLAAVLDLALLAVIAVALLVRPLINRRRSR